MKVFVTGHKGYIGTHLVAILKEDGHYVTGCDLGIFEDCCWSDCVKPDTELIKDIRDLSPKDLNGYDVIMHLAAISNDPMGDLDENLTYAINLQGSVNLATIAKTASVPRFIFSGSCSVYGKGEKLDLDEKAKFNPVSAYAISKVKAEEAISALSDNYFSPTFLRNSTAYGSSPMLRIDLVANNLLACAVTRGDIRIMSDGSPWRPLIHAKDIASAFLAFAKAPREKIHNKAINVGSNVENYQVKEVAGYVKRLVPAANIVYTGEVGEDPRNYRVNFNLLNELLPEFILAYNLDTGLEDLYQQMVKRNFNVSDFEGDKFVRLRTLKKKIYKIRR